MLEDIEDYQGFEAAIIADFHAQTAVERELALRLASLLWRIRRTVAIETALFRTNAQALREQRLDQSLTYLALGSTNMPSLSQEKSNSGASCGSRETDQRSAQFAIHAPTRPKTWPIASNVW